MATTDGHGDGDGARLWAALRALSDAERRRVQRVLTRFRALDGDGGGRDSQANHDDANDDHANDSNGRLVVRLPAEGDAATAQEWAPLAFVHALLAHLRELAHEQSHVEGAASDPAAAHDNETKPASAAAFSLQKEDFPSLAKTRTPEPVNVRAPAVTPATRAPAKPTKRRITTTLIATDAPYAAVAVKPPTTAPLAAETGVASTSENAWSKRSLLEKRMAASNSPGPAGPSPLKPSVERRAALLMGDDAASPPPPPKKPELEPHVPPTTASNPWMSPPPTLNTTERKPPSLALAGKAKRGKRVSLTTTSSDPSPAIKLVDTKNLIPTVAPLTPVEANLQGARLYGHLIVQRLVPNICGEIRFLVGLLYRPSCANAAMNAHAKCAPTNEFCLSHTSSAFAAAAFETLEPTLALLGVDMVQLVAKSLDEVKLCANLVVRLRSALEAREERRVEESAKMGCELPVETKGAAFRDYALPFCEDMDSRLNYRSPTETVIYSNREKIRDAFLAQLRAFQKKQNSLLGAASDASGAPTAAQDTQQLLQEVMPENLWWFARFFVLELVQVGSNPLGESDKDLVLKIMEDKMVVKNPDRLRKLHRRFTSQKLADPASSGSTATGFQHNTRPKTSNQQPARQGTKVEKAKTNGPSGNTAALMDTKSAVAGNSNDKSRATDQMRGHFSDNQAFFYHFLVSCDSYQFAELVKHQLEAQFLSIWRAKSKADPRKEFTETVLRLKVLAKFIGFLRFSPLWHWAALTSALTSKNPALEAAQREAVTTLEQSQSANTFDVVILLEESIVSNTVAKCIPWLCDYLSMLSSDGLSPSTRYIQRALLLIAYVHRSRMLDSLGETGLFVAMQIERLFQLLAANELLQENSRWHRIADKPPTWMKPEVVQALLRNNVGVPPVHHTDGLPFLYSSMFVQVCISELDDLRGFIQTRSNPHHRSAGGTSRRAHLSGTKASTIRKVRPLQVVSEDQLELSSSLAQTDKPDKDSNQASDDDNDPLRDAFFKLYPQLRRAVEFVVDMVVTNMCEHAVSKYVKPNADALIDSCVEDAKAHAPSFTQLILHGFQVRLDERLEDFMTTTVMNALQEATDLCSSRVDAALRPLIAPSVPKQLVSAATTIAQAQAKSAITTLITRSLRAEFLKRIAIRKRAIVKEAGAMSVAGNSSGDTSSGSDDPARKDSIARALKFSFDDSADASTTPLEEALHTMKINVMGMHGLLQTIARSRKRGMTARSVTSFVRFERAFRSALDDAITEVDHADVLTRKQNSVLMWSWIWRCVRLCLKVFTVLVDEATAEEVEAQLPTSGASLVGDFVTSFTKTMVVIARLQPEAPDATVQHPVSEVLCFVAQIAVSVPVAIPQAHAPDPAAEDNAFPTAVVDACAMLYAKAVRLSQSDTSLRIGQSCDDAIASAIILKASTLS